MTEAEYQMGLIKRIKERLVGSIVLKNDSSYQQGIPDLTVLYLNHWAMLEVKAYRGAPEQPNQRYFVNLADAMSFGCFIYPENEEKVLDALQHTFSSRRSSLLP